jgi:hypothetical protein
MPSCIILAPLAGLYVLSAAICGVEATVIMCAIVGVFAVATRIGTASIPLRASDWAIRPALSPPSQFRP